ncbi:chaperone modulator CbpM [Gillisia sp. M10.2A]|uniref:Chaperone modulator CbpM n=1 Tax=Gillisia lutea TaxID=2909668 RepID=A0ABS9EC82_9FLAO|nr:chaperone modulator CbpM [Gillisia lutea]MCF4100497.1 chaperone modulator CbpM [Gillisia lutea]
MNLDELISTQDICLNYKVEHTFIHSLRESGLIEIITLKEKDYVHCDRISEFERFRRLHYELDINLEGLEAITNLLERLEQLHQENQRLKNRLEMYE